MKNVLITGGSRGIGYAICRKLSQNKDYRIFINYNHSEKKALDLQDEINSSGGFGLAVKADVSKSSEVNNMFNEIVKIYGGIDILINNAGISKVGLFQDMSSEEWQEIFNVNLNGTFNTIKAALPYMLSKHSGRILNFSSVWGQNAASCEVAYAATKGAIESMTRSLAAELAPSGILINAIAPGAIKTSMMEGFSDEDIKLVEEDIPMCRIGNPEEVAEVVDFIVSEKNTYMTGQIIGVNGGFCI